MMNKSLIDPSNLSQNVNITKCNGNNSHLSNLYTTNWKTMNHNASTGDILNQEIDEVICLKREIKRLNRNFKLNNENKRKSEVEMNCIISSQKHLIQILQAETKDKDNLIDSLKKYAMSFLNDLTRLSQMIQNGMQLETTSIAKDISNTIEKMIGKYQKVPPYYDYTTSVRNWQKKVIMKEQKKLEQASNVVLSPQVPNDHINSTMITYDNPQLNYKKKEACMKRNNDNRNMTRNKSLIYNRRPVTMDEFSKDKNLPTVIYRDSRKIEDEYGYV